MSDLAKDRFSRVAAHMIPAVLDFLLTLLLNTYTCLINEPPGVEF